MQNTIHFLVHILFHIRDTNYLLHHISCTHYHREFSVYSNGPFFHSQVHIQNNQSNSYNLNSHLKNNTDYSTKRNLGNTKGKHHLSCNNNFHHLVSIVPYSNQNITQMDKNDFLMVHKFQLLHSS